MIQDVDVSFLRDKKEQRTDLEGNGIAHEGRRAVAGLPQAQKAFASLCIFPYQCPDCLCSFYRCIALHYLLCAIVHLASPLFMDIWVVANHVL